MTRMDRRISMIPNLLAAMVLVAVTAPGLADDLTNDLKIEQQGSFQIGGSQRTVNGATRRFDHMYVFYQIPKQARKYPLVLVHGGGQSGKQWESTPDGREGFQGPTRTTHLKKSASRAR